MTSPTSTGRVVGGACVRHHTPGPADTMVWIAARSPPRSAMTESMRAAISSSVCPGRRFASMSSNAASTIAPARRTHSISAGLDYPVIGPEHAWLHEMGRVQYLSATDSETLEAFKLCSMLEGIIPALEPAHALARVLDIAPSARPST